MYAPITKPKKILCTNMRTWPVNLDSQKRDQWHLHWAIIWNSICMSITCNEIFHFTVHDWKASNQQSLGIGWSFGKTWQALRSNNRHYIDLMYGHALDSIDENNHYFLFLTVLNTRCIYILITAGCSYVCESKIAPYNTRGVLWYHGLPPKRPGDLFCIRHTLRHDATTRSIKTHTHTSEHIVSAKPK